VLDVGINRDADGKLCGDVDFAAALDRASWITHGARRRRSDDDRDAARQYAAGRRTAGRRALTYQRVPQLAEFQEHRALIGLLGQIGERFPQSRDDRRAPQAKERVDVRSTSSVDT
jgi:hypothetical protein